MQEFKESLKLGKFTTSKCLTCQALIWPPNRICPKCHSSRIDWIEVPDRGTLLQFSETFLANEPTIFGLVKLDDNIRLLGKIMCHDTSQLKEGMSVKMVNCGVQDNDNIYYEFQPI